MRTAIKETDVYTFDELDESAKQTAIDWFREGNLDYEWWDFVYDDATEIGKILGIEIDKIYFSGFSSQGDGACFEGSYSYEKGSVKNVKSHAPRDTELHQIALDLSKAQRKRFYQLTANVKQSGHYMHEMCTEINVYDDYGALWCPTDADTEDSIIETLRDFMRWIYKQLESEYDFQNSDETIIDNIEGNAYEFTENGEVY